MRQIRKRRIFGHQWLLAIGLMALILLTAPMASASVVLYLSDQQMTLKADCIVRAKVTKMVSRWEKATKRIYTYITLVVMDPIKGTRGSQEIQIRQMGGIANGVGMYIPGAAKFKLGEELLVFLEKINKTKFHHVMGMSFGKFEIVTDPKSKLQTLRRKLKGISLARRTVKGKLKLQHGHALQHNHNKPLLLNAYVNKLRGYLREAKLRKLPKKPSVPTVKRAIPIPVKRVIPRVPAVKKPGKSPQ